MSIKRVLIFILKSLLVISLYSSCSRKEVDTLTTEFRLTVNLNAKPKPGAYVYLYRSLTDNETGIRPLASTTTNGDGVAIFKNLQSIEYYVYAVHEEGNALYDNSKKSYRLFDDLIDGAVTIGKIDIEYARPSNPTTLVINSLELIRFDTTNWARANSSNCSDTLIFEVIATTSDNLREDTLGKTSSELNFCYRQGIPLFSTPSSKFENTIKIDLNKYNYISLNIIRAFPEKDSLYYFKDDDYSKLVFNTRGIALNDYIKNNEKGNVAFPNRFRIMEGEVKSPPAPRYISTIIDLRVSWE